MTADNTPTTKTEEPKGELTEEQLNDVSGGPIYMNVNTLVPAVQTNPTTPIGTFTGGVKGG